MPAELWQLWPPSGASFIHSFEQTSHTLDLPRFCTAALASGGHLSGPTSPELTMAITAAPEARPRRGEADGREAAARAYEPATGAQVVLARWPSALAASAARVAPDPEAAAVEPSSVFMLTSITKPATAMALLVLATTTWAGAAAIAASYGHPAWPLWISLGALGAVVVSTLAAWAAHGRHTLPLRHLLLAPLYVLWKAPLYLAFFLRRGQRSWNRTARG